ncbi:cytochrome ubiquinol oxidase subunit II [Robbsia sp. Bb-Pol-6]|uniref:Cytochrome ubiquinol oxidase subunit II n=1 Tax=Robbsia betulipollinis TaxID=2981849 RepID=A0ABT3ZJI8_9BURK|nr:cytochrome ubiquinol oxidase subunit II [Robbsia betulipollinis]MCY0386680.1 cytochrome ubiquinol oxidase subunit II [Robbsia betulipollinis]
MRERVISLPKKPCLLRSFASIGSTFRFIAVFPAFFLFSACTSGRHLSFLDPQGPIASIQRTHFIEMLALLSVLVAIPIFILLPWFAWRYRYDAKSSRYTPEWSFSRSLEIVAWSGPAVIVALLAVLVWRSTHALDPYKPIASAAPPLRIQVIGYDWKWLFIYPDLGIASIGILPLPVDRPVAMDITSATVMQSLFIPALGGQIYAMGGMVSQLHLLADKPGRFMGENTMYSGNGFHQQNFTAVAMTATAFSDWVKHVQSNERPLDAAALSRISERSTRAQLVAALGVPATGNDGIAFNHVSPTLFTGVVNATMKGTGSASPALDQTTASERFSGGASLTPPSQGSHP